MIIIIIIIIIIKQVVFPSIPQREESTFSGDRTLTGNRKKYQIYATHRDN